MKSELYEMQPVALKVMHTLNLKIRSASLVNISTYCLRFSKSHSYMTSHTGMYY